MKQLLYIIFVILVVGCSSNDDVYSYHEIKEYQGNWRDTILFSNKIYVEDLTIKDNSIKYSLSDVSTHVVLDTLIGTLVVGKENKIGWVCFSPIDNKTRQTVWNVIELSPYQMTLYSNIYGERNYKKAHYSTLEDEGIKDILQNVERDILMEMLQYQKYLPLHKNDLIEKFGYHNRLVESMGFAYYLHHSLLDKISFIENYENDSIYSYTLSVKDWTRCISIIQSNYVKLRDVGVSTEYIDAETLEASKNVIITDPTTKQMSIKPIKDYDYWPNISHYIGKDLETFLDDFRSKYVYKFHENLNLGLYEYSFQAHKDSICSDIFVIVDSNNIIQQSGVCMINTYLSSSSSRKKEAQKELDKFSQLLRMKYFLDREGMDENGNKVYYYHPNRQKDESPYEIRLRLRQYQNGIIKLYQVAVNYILL